MSEIRIAEQMASAPKSEVETAVAKAQPAKADKAKAATVPFSLVTFKAVQRNPFPANKDGSVTREIAEALCKINGTELHFVVAVRATRPANGKPEDEILSIAMPNRGKATGYARLFTSDHQQTIDALDKWTSETLPTAYLAWESKNGGAPAVLAVSKQGGIRRGDVSAK